jgi:hypothetical protein
MGWSWSWCWWPSLAGWDSRPARPAEVYVQVTSENHALDGGRAEDVTNTQALHPAAVLFSFSLDGGEGTLGVDLCHSHAASVAGRDALAVA